MYDQLSGEHDEYNFRQTHSKASNKEIKYLTGVTRHVVLKLLWSEHMHFKSIIAKCKNR